MNPLKNYIQIRVDDFLSQFNIFTEDRKYITNVRFRKVPNEVVQLVTDEAYKSTEYVNVLKRHLVATYEFETYEIEIDSDENIHVTEIQLGSSITVIDENLIWYQCNVFSIEQIQQADSSLYQTIVKLEIIYKYQGNGANKALITTEGFFHDFVTSNYLLEKYDIRDLYKLQLSNYEAISGVSSFTIYTKFFPKKVFIEKNYNKTELQSGDEIVNKKIGFEAYILTAYLTETQKVQLEKLGNLCYYRNNVTQEHKGIILSYEGTSSQWAGVKPIEYEFEENTDLNNLGIYKVKITIFTEKLNYSPNLNL